LAEITKKKILIVTDSYRIQTGFANVGRHIADHLYATGRWDIAYLGWYDQESAINRPHFRLYTTRLDAFGQVDQNDKYARFSFPIAIEHESPDVVLCIGDIWMCQYYVNAMTGQGPANYVPEYLRNTYKIVNYLAIDGEPVPNYTKHQGLDLDWPKTMAQMDKVVCFSQWAKDAVNIRSQKSVERDVCHDWFHHGVDTSVYRPFPKDAKAMLKKKFFRLPEHVPLFGMFSRNQPRKAQDKAIEAFAKYLKMLPPNTDARIYFHCPIIDQGWNLRDLADDYGVAKNVILNERLQVGMGVTDGELNELYNACDATVLPTRSEGFGLTVLESMSAGTPVITTDYSAQAEFSRDNGALLIKVQTFDHEPGLNIKRAMVDTDHLASLYKRISSDPKLREDLGRKGRRKAISMDWYKICCQWDEFLWNIDISTNAEMPQHIPNSEQGEIVIREI